MIMGHRDRRPDDAAPQPDERIPRGKTRRRPATPDGGPPIEQDRLEVPRQGVDIDRLARLAARTRAPLASLGQADVPPVRRAIAGGVKPARVDEGLHEHRPQAVMRLPVACQSPDRHRQRLRGQTFDPHPWQDQKTTVSDHHVQMRLPRPILPSDPVIAARHGRRCGFEQQAAELASLTVTDDVAQMRAERTPVAQVMILLDGLVPVRDRFPAGRQVNR